MKKLKNKRKGCRSAINPVFIPTKIKLFSKQLTITKYPFFLGKINQLRL